MRQPNLAFNANCFNLGFLNSQHPGGGSSPARSRDKGFTPERSRTVELRARARSSRLMLVAVSNQIANISQNRAKRLPGEESKQLFFKQKT